MHNRPEIQDRTSCPTILYAWLLYCSCVVTVIHSYIAHCYVSDYYIVLVTSCDTVTCTSILCEWFLYSSCVVTVMWSMQLERLSEIRQSTVVTICTALLNFKHSELYLIFFACSRFNYHQNAIYCLTELQIWYL